MAGLQSGEGRIVIDSVVWAQYINVTDTQSHTSPWQMPRREKERKTRTLDKAPLKGNPAAETLAH